MTGPTFSTHVLDVAGGRPAAGVRVSLRPRSGPAWEGVTGADGRWRPAGELKTGDYDLDFDVNDHFPADHLYEKVTLHIRLTESRHYHVPLLISPFGLSSYRGS